MRLLCGGPSGGPRPPRLRGSFLLHSRAAVAAKTFLQRQQQPPQQPNQLQQRRLALPFAGFTTHTAAAAAAAAAPAAPADSLSQQNRPPVRLPPYVQQLTLGSWTFFFYPVPQYLKSIEGALVGGPHGALRGPLGAPRGGPQGTLQGGPQGGPEGLPQEGPSAWEGAVLVAEMQPRLLCLECCSSRLQQLAAAAAAATAAAAARGSSLEAEIRKQQRQLAKGLSLLTSFDGGLLHAALLPVVVAAGALQGLAGAPGGPPRGAPQFFQGSPPSACGGPLGDCGSPPAVEGDPPGGAWGPPGPPGGPPGPLVYAIDRSKTTTARRLQECLLLQATQLRAFRRCVLEALGTRWAWGPPDPRRGGPPSSSRGGPQYLGGVPPTSGAWRAPQWAQQQKELFPAGYQVLLEERASCAAANIWNAIQDAEARMGLGGPPKGPGGSCGGPSGDPLGPPGEALQQEGPRGPSAGGPAAQGAPSPAQAEGEGYAEYLGGEPPGPPERGRVLGEGPPRGVPQGDPWEPAKGTPGGPRVGFVFCSAALLPLLIEALQQVHAVEAPKAAAAAAAAADAAAGKKAHYRTSMFADLHRSPPCLLPLLLLRFVLLPAAAAYGISAAVAALSSWARGYLHRGEPPAAAAAELHVPIDGDLLPQRRQRPRRGPPEGGPPRGPL